MDPCQVQVPRDGDSPNPRCFPSIVFFLISSEHDVNTLFFHVFPPFEWIRKPAVSD